jgi:hypothetical protein
MLFAETHLGRGARACCILLRCPCRLGHSRRQSDTEHQNPDFAVLCMRVARARLSPGSNRASQVREPPPYVMALHFGVIILQRTDEIPCSWPQREQNSRCGYDNGVNVGIFGLF